MSRQRETAAAAGSEAEPLPWSPRVRGIVSLFLAFHVAAVFLGPCSTPPEMASGLSRNVAQGIGPYMSAMSLYNGYRFFAPEPSPSHLVQYRLLLRDGSVKEGRFPDVEQHWPRQLYHRHFMLAETINAQTAGLFPPPPHSVDPTAGRRHEEVKKRLLQPVAQRLMIDHDAEMVDLWCVQHQLPSREQFLSRPTLNDEQSYQYRILGTFRRQ